MRTTRDGKQRRTQREWAELVARFRQSGLTLKAFAERENLSLGSLQRWNRRLGGEAQCDFIDVTPQTPPTPNGSSQAGSDWDLELELPSGLTLRLRG